MAAIAVQAVLTALHSADHGPKAQLAAVQTFASEALVLAHAPLPPRLLQHSQAVVLEWCVQRVGDAGQVDPAELETLWSIIARLWAHDEVREP